MHRSKEVMGFHSVCCYIRCGSRMLYILDSLDTMGIDNPVKTLYEMENTLCITNNHLTRLLLDNYSPYITYSYQLKINTDLSFVAYQPPIEVENYTLVAKFFNGDDNYYKLSS